MSGLTRNGGNTSTQAINASWPDLLAQDFLNGRIITYGIGNNIAWVNDNAQDLKSLVSHSQRLAFEIRKSRKDKIGQCRRLYFITDSIGGLIVEQALLDETLHDITCATAGIICVDRFHKDSVLCGGVENAFQNQTKNEKLRHVKLFESNETFISNHLSGVTGGKMSAGLGDSTHGTHDCTVESGAWKDDEYSKVKAQLMEWLSSRESLPKKQRTTSTKINRRKPPSLVQYGTIFNGVSNSVINANQYSAGSSLYYNSRDRQRRQAT